MAMPLSARLERRSTQLLLVSLVTTALAAAVGQSLMFGLFTASRNSPAPAAASPALSRGGPLVVGIARTPGGPAEWTTYVAVFARLQRDLGRPVVLCYSTDRSKLTDQLRHGRIDLGLVPVASYLSLHQACEATLVAAPIIAGHRTDAAVMVVRGDSPARTIGDLAGKRVALTPGSLAGGAFAYWLMERNGSGVATFFASVLATGTQDAHLGMVARGEVDAACVNRSDLASWHAGAFRVVAASPEFGMPPIVARPGLPTATVEAVRAELAGSEVRAAIPSSSAIGGFAVARDSDYAFCRLLVPFLAQVGSIEAGPR